MSTDHEAQPAEAVQPLSLGDALELAVRLHRAGKLDDAEKLYGYIIAAAPDYADALHFMGVLVHMRGRSDEALGLIRRSVALNASVPDWYNNLGNVLLETGQVDEAADAYAQANALAPERPDVANNLGVLRRQQNRLPEAEAFYRRAIALDPGYADAFTNLGRLLTGQERHEEALIAYCEALVVNPRFVKARHALGMAYQMLGRLDQATQVYRDWLAEEPGHPEALHHLAACTGEAVPERAPDAYVEAVFDDFANSFDAKLAMLDYRAPALVGDVVAQCMGEPRRELDVLDAGCGTGLCGPLLAPFARRLEGIDLSERMLGKAQQREVYDALVKAELTAFLVQAPTAYDLIVSADTLCYFGELRPVCEAAARSLRPAGVLIFTLEASSGEDAQDFRLHPHGRYSHREDYLRRVLAGAGLSLEAMQQAQLRMENARPVEGWVVSCKKTPVHSSSAQHGTEVEKMSHA
ncbi:tetratricopeptide repeat protein [Variovorax sp. KK3]|uniref:tetratricopeptide repeat protein n=1 Tax=Variovorax sp. KK3 TaxID=1855728 RepID=UPI0009F8FB09|nr:tetratricopeptide repeat protein [Variovorax sp. KK3]